MDHVLAIMLVKEVRTCSSDGIVLDTHVVISCYS